MFDQTFPFAISPTDENWFKFLKANQLNSTVNFWTPTPWNVKQVQKNEKWFFLLKSPIRKIAGFGEFVQYKNLTIDEAWNEFGLRNGTKDRQELINKVLSYATKNSKHEIKDLTTHKIGCIILNNCEYWESDDFKSPEELEIDFKPQIVKFKYYPAIKPLFELLNEPREDYKKEVNQRRGQGVFKGVILKAYNNTCCISGEQCPELLEAAHIQNYLNESSNHVQNGLLMRVDLHRLFDNALLYIDESYIVHVSELLTDEIYLKFNGKKIILPSAISDYPSKEALASRKDNFRTQ